MKMGTAKGSVQQRRTPRKGLGEFLPTSVQKSYFTLSKAVRDVLNTALKKYRPGQYEPILIGGSNRLKPALKLMTYYRLVIEEIKDAEVITSYTRWVEAVQVRGTENPEVFLIFSPRFERIWMESKKRLQDHVAQNPGNIGLRSQYAIRLYSWAQKYVTAGTKRVSLEELRKVLGLESVKDADAKMQISSRKHLYRSGQTSAKEPWIPPLQRSTRKPI
jgi:hypothetical protein